MSHARELIAAGMVPDSSSFTYEGLYSEYDLPVAAETHGDGLLQAGATQAYVGDTRLDPRGLFVHLSFSAIEDSISGTLEQDLDLAVVLDISGSMTLPINEYGSRPKIDLAKQSLKDLLSRLDGNDRLSITLFNDRATTLLPPTYVDDTASIAATIDTIRAHRSTDMESGLAMGLGHLAEPRLEGSATQRLLLFTDFLPNVGNTSAGGFRDQIESSAAEGIGISLFGIGLGQSFELANFMANVHGGNYRNIVDDAGMRELFTSVDFDYLMHPIAHDLQLQLDLPAGIELLDSYGFPGNDENGAVPILEAKSLFLSRNRGAILLRLTPRCARGVELGDLVLSYRNLDGTLQEDTITITYSGPDEEQLENPTPFVEGDGTRLAILLTRYLHTMREACHRYHTSNGTSYRAPASLEDLIDVLAEEQEYFESPQLKVERDTAIALWETMTGETWVAPGGGNG